MSHQAVVVDTEARPGRNWLMGREAFEGIMPHHGGIQALWETKWKAPVSLDTFGFLFPSAHTQGGSGQC